jgi:hypothetical protein
VCATLPRGAASTRQTDGRGASCGCDVDGLPYVVAGIKRWLMKLKSREIYSGTRPQSMQILRILSVVSFVLLSILRRVKLEASPFFVSVRGHACRLKTPSILPLTAPTQHWLHYTMAQALAIQINHPF